MNVLYGLLMFFAALAVGALTTLVVAVCFMGSLHLVRAIRRGLR